MQEWHLLKENGLWEKMVGLEHRTDESKRELQTQHVRPQGLQLGSLITQGQKSKMVPSTREGRQPPPKETPSLPAKVSHLWTLCHSYTSRITFTELMGRLSTSQPPRCFRGQLLTPSIQLKVPYQEGREGGKVNTQVHHPTPLLSV